MPSYLSKPDIKVDLGYPAFTVEGRSAVGIRLTCVENGFFTATVDFHKPKHDLLTQLLKHAPITVYLKDRSRSSWETFFDGEVHFLKKSVSAQQGTTISAKCDGSGFGFAEMLVAQEYGYQSANPAVKTLLQILSDAGIGMVPKWINKIMSGSTDSGYSYGTSHIDDIVGDVPYLYYPYKPASKSLADLLDIVQALQDPGDPGPHFLVNHAGEVLVTPVGNHSVDVAAQGWPTYVGGSVDAATLEQGVDFLVFDFNEETELANYILYHSKLRWPGNGDLTETVDITEWNAEPNTTVSYDTALQKIGIRCLKLLRDTTAALPIGVQYNNGLDLGLDITKAGGIYNIPYFSFWAMRDATLGSTGLVQIGMQKNFEDYYLTEIDLAKLLPNANEWHQCSLPVGPNWATPGLSGVFTGWTKSLVHSGEYWNEINYFNFICMDGGPVGAALYLDGLCFEGYVLRAALNSTLIGASSTKMRIINDSFAKGDTLIASDDSGTIALLAKAELLRQQTTPVVATINARLIRKALPGQLVHIHALPDGSGGWALDKDFRITQPTHNIGSASTQSSLSITDDIVNSLTRPAMDSQNAVVKSYRPEFQDRQSTGTKMRDIDITQAILSVDYG